MDFKPPERLSATGQGYELAVDAQNDAHKDLGEVVSREGSAHSWTKRSTDVRSWNRKSLFDPELRILRRDTRRKKTDEAGLKNPPFSCAA